MILAITSSTALQLGETLSLWLGIGGVLAAIIGIALSAYFYRKSKQIRRLAYTVATANLIQDYSSKIPDLKIEYRGKNPPTISVSRIAIWNDGTETINHTDIAELEPLRILCDSEVLDWSVVSLTTAANQFRLQVSEPPDLVLARIDFDYLDRAEGGIVQLIHTAKTGDSIQLAGRVKGSGQPVRREFGPNPTLNTVSDRMTSIGAFVFVVLSLVYLVAKGPLEDILVFAVVIAIFPLFAGIALGLLARRFSMVPKQFESTRKIV